MKAEVFLPQWDNFVGAHIDDCGQSLKPRPIGKFESELDKTISSTGAGYRLTMVDVKNWLKEKGFRCE